MRSRRNPVLLIAILSPLPVSAGGCATGRTVLVPDDSPIRVGPGTTGKAYSMVGGEWVLGDRRVAYPEGWYVVPPRFVHPDEFAEGGPP